MKKPVKLPKGMRNNNPLNVEFDTEDPWQGLAGSDGRFAIFKDAKWGIRAGAVILLNYQRKHKLKTIRKIISRWAPGSENPTESYIDAVSSRVGIEDTAEIDLTDSAVMGQVLKAMVTVECGRQDYGDEVYNEAMKLAGLEVKPKELHKSRTMLGILTTALSMVLGYIFENQELVAGVVGVIVPHSAGAVAKVLGVLSLVYAAYARVDDHRKGVK